MHQMLPWEPQYYIIEIVRFFQVAYTSRTLLDRERRYCVIDRECYGIVWGIEKFVMYLYGKLFTLQTDHRPLQLLSALKFESSRIMRWALALQSYNLKVENIQGKDNVGADFLSRTVE